MDDYDLPELNAIQQDRDAIIVATQALAQLKADARERLSVSMRQLAERIGDNDDLAADVIGYLYWHTQDIPVQCIAEGFGIDQFGVRKVAESAGAYIEIACRSCGKPVKVTLKNRSDFQMHKQKSWHRFTVCPECKARESASTTQYWAAVEARLNELRTMPYYSYLQTPEWQDRRKRHLKRAHYRCQVCNTNKARLNVHHRTYERRGDEDDRDLIVLCEDCHRLFHEQGKLA